ncbi:MAG TPA: beta-propeller fold lactonase family protein [Phycisphaerae bacterium]|nr:beta-propeller fold lactonase family protein [Phycisphaerae bacterium]
MGRAAGLILLSLMTLEPGGCQSSTPSPPPSGQSSELLFWGDQRIGLWSLCGENPSQFFHDPVSIAPFQGSEYFVANYQDVMKIDIDIGRICRMKSDWADLYNPTGISYSPVNQLLYVANYNANNILIFQVNDQQLHAVAALPTDRSPEGVSVSDDGNYLAVATYDGQSIQLFDTHSGENLWTKHNGLSHGVCIVDRHVYGTDLSSSELLDIDLFSGTELRRVGTKGLDETKFQSLWPTYVSRYNNQLLVADGLGGFIYVVDQSTLQPLRVFGHNGPSDKYLMMPYCAIGNGDTILVGSEAQDRILVMNDGADGLHVTRSLNRYLDQWDYLRGQIDAWPTDSLPIVRNEFWDFPTCTSCRDLHMFGAIYKAGYRVLARASDFDPIASAAYPFGLPLQLFLANPLGGIYADDFLFTTVLPSDRGYLFVSSREEIATYFATVDGVPYYVPARVERGTWVINGELYGPRTHGYAADLIATMDGCIDKLEAARASNGYVSLDQLRKAFFYHRYDVKDLVEDRGQGSFEDGFDGIVALNFESDEGKAFLAKYMTWSDQTPRAEMTQAAQSYYKDILSHDVIRLPEFVLVSMLTGYAG